MGLDSTLGVEEVTGTLKRHFAGAVDKMIANQPESWKQSGDAFMLADEKAKATQLAMMSAVAETIAENNQRLLEHFEQRLSSLA